MCKLCFFFFLYFFISGFFFVKKETEKYVFILVYCRIMHCSVLIYQKENNPVSMNAFVPNSKLITLNIFRVKSICWYNCVRIIENLRT